jgi:hypothetical protein
VRQESSKITLYDFRSTDDDRLRQEHIDDEVFEFKSAFTAVSEFYKTHAKGRSVYWKVTSVYWKVMSVYWKVTSVYWKVTSLNWKVTSVYWKVTSVYWKVTSVYWKVTSVYWKVCECAERYSTNVILYHNSCHSSIFLCCRPVGCTICDQSPPSCH